MRPKNFDSLESMRNYLRADPNEKEMEDLEEELNAKPKDGFIKLEVHPPGVEPEDDEDELGGFGDDVDGAIEKTEQEILAIERKKRMDDVLLGVAYRVPDRKDRLRIASLLAKKNPMNLARSYAKRIKDLEKVLRRGFAAKETAHGDEIALVDFERYCELMTA